MTSAYDALLAAVTTASDADALLQVTEEGEGRDDVYERILEAAVEADLAMVRAFVAAMRAGWPNDSEWLTGVLGDLEEWAE